MCVLILRAYVSSYYEHMCPQTASIFVLILLRVSSYYYLCVLILLYMCPHTIIYVSSHYSAGEHACADDSSEDSNADVC
jgi:hypothetical protein